MKHEEVEARLTEARNEDGVYDFRIIAEMNAKGVYFTFTPQGVSYQFDKFET